jgi:hypothetical protein
MTALRDAFARGVNQQQWRRQISAAIQPGIDQIRLPAIGV